MPRDTDYVTPWPFRFEASAVIIYMVLGAYVMFSDFGFISNDPSIMQVYGFCGVILMFGVVSNYVIKRRKHKEMSKLNDMYTP